MSNKCNFCNFRSDTLQASLRHELLTHIITKTENTYYFQNKHLKALKCCKPGKELESLFKLFYYDEEQIQKLKKSISGDLKRSLHVLGHLNLQTFGSIENGLMLKDSDVDIFITTPGLTEENKIKFYELIKDLLHHQAFFNKIKFISKARVRLIKCHHLSTDMYIDINCDSPESVGNTIFKELFMFDKRFLLFARFIKIWCKQWKIIGQYLMSSYCLCTLILFYLQRTKLVPSIQQLQHNVPPKIINGNNYAFNFRQHMRPLPNFATIDLIKGFFIFYNSFDIKNNIISTFLAKLISVADSKSKRFILKGNDIQFDVVSFKMLESDTPMVVHDPFQVNCNISKVVTQKHLEYFQRCFKKAAEICEKMNETETAKFYEALLLDYT